LGELVVEGWCIHRTKGLRATRATSFAAPGRPILPHLRPERTPCPVLVLVPRLSSSSSPSSVVHALALVLALDPRSSVLGVRSSIFEHEREREREDERGDERRKTKDERR